MYPLLHAASNRWYIQIDLGNRPPEKFGSFDTKAQAVAWIEAPNVVEWYRLRLISSGQVL